MTYRYQGKQYDCGSKAGFLEATVAYGLKHPEVGDEFREILLRMSQELAYQTPFTESYTVTDADTADTRSPAILQRA